MHLYNRTLLAHLHEIEQAIQKYTVAQSRGVLGAKKAREYNVNQHGTDGKRDGNTAKVKKKSMSRGVVDAIS